MIILASKFLEEIKEFPKDSHGRLECEANYKKEVINDIGEILAGGSVTAQQLNILFDKEKENPQKTLYYKPCNILDQHSISYVRKAYRVRGNEFRYGDDLLGCVFIESAEIARRSGCTLIIVESTHKAKKLYERHHFTHIRKTTIGKQTLYIMGYNTKNLIDLL